MQQTSETHWGGIKRHHQMKGCKEHAKKQKEGTSEWREIRHVNQIWRTKWETTQEE